MRDLVHGRPVLHWKRQQQRRWQTAQFVRSPAREGSARELARAIRGKRVLVTVAFNYPDTIQVQQTLLRRHVGDCERVVIDNSSSDQAAEEIAELCRQHGARYLRLPPARRWETITHSHVAAMNWTWRNVLRPGAPKLFGFIDHDIYPQEPCDPFEALDDFPFHGAITNGPEGSGRWHLWAGYCFFRFDYAVRRRMNFDYDFDAGLDTGGGNWRSIYRHVRRSDVPAARWVEEPLVFEDEPAGKIQWVGSWVHKTNHSYDQSSARDAKNRWMRSLIDT